jgi:hypothetical protein
MSENPNMKMLIDDGWRQSHVITGPNLKLVAQIFQPMDGADYDTDSDDYSDNDEDYGDEGRVYRVMCREGIIEE